MVQELWIGKNLEENYQDLIEVPCRHLPEDSEEENDNLRIVSFPAEIRTEHTASINYASVCHTASINYASVCPQYTSVFLQIENLHGNNPLFVRGESHSTICSKSINSLFTWHLHSCKYYDDFANPTQFHLYILCFEGSVLYLYSQNV
jgi:hypothetical protein